MTLIINQFLCLNRNLRFFVRIFDHFNHIYVDWRKQNRFIDYLFVNEACYLMAICFCQTNGKNNERGLDWFTKLLSTTLCNVDRVYQVFWSLLTEQCKMINEKKKHFDFSFISRSCGNWLKYFLTQPNLSNVSKKSIRLKILRGKK